MSKLRVGTALVATALLTTACTGEILNSGIDRHGVPHFFNYAASKGEVSTTIVGNPFQTPKAQVDQTILSVMDKSHFGPQTRFTTDPGPAAARDYRVVLVLDPPKSMTPAQVCTVPASADGPGMFDPARLGLMAAFCVQDEPFSWVTASIPTTASPDDPAFKQMVGRTTMKLLPSRDPTEGGDSCRVPPC